MRGVNRSRAGDERGGIAIVVALSTVMMFGMAAIVVDVGRLYQERRELQNGADAGALAIAEDCGMGDCGPYSGTATSLADANALDGMSAVDGIDINMGAQTVEVDTSTSDPDGGSMILHWFAPLIGSTGDTVRSSATAEWAPLGHSPTIPLTISQCEWANAGGTVGSPGVPPVIPSGTVTFAFHDGNAADACAGPAGQDIPGGFGWLDTAGGCEADVTANEWAGSSPGAAPPSSCSLGDFLDQEVIVPVFQDASGTGQNASFQMWGFATIRITGVRLLMGNSQWTGGDISTCDSLLPTTTTTTTTTTTAPPGPGRGNSGGGGGSVPTVPTTPTVQSPQDMACLVGEFTENFEPAGIPGDVGTTPNLGTIAVRLIK